MSKHDFMHWIPGIRSLHTSTADMADRYNYLRLVGKGSFGKAWLVQSKSSQRQYVVKEIQVGNMADKDRHQAVNEVAILARLKHKNVVRYREAFVEAGTLNIVMAYANGGKRFVHIWTQVINRS